jgi:hypothetical protein
MRWLILALAIPAAVGATPKERTAIFDESNAPKLIAIGFDHPEGIRGYWMPEEKDLVAIEDRLDQFLHSTWEKNGVKEKRVIPWDLFYRQIAGIIKDGRKMIYISYVIAGWGDPEEEAQRKKEIEKKGKHYDPNWWKSKPIVVQDGGWSVFRVIFDPKENHFVWYEHN